MTTQLYDPGNVPIQTMVLQGNPITVLSRVQDQNGNLITQSSVSSISVEVWDMEDGSSGEIETASVSGSVSNTLQTDGRWTTDSIGYNLAVTLDTSAFGTGDHQYQVQIGITPTTGNVFYLVANAKTRLFYKNPDSGG